MIRVPERYKGLLEAHPEFKRYKDYKYYAGLMALSIGKKDFSDLTAMQEYATFMKDHFVHSVLLIADLPKIHNIMALEGVSWNEAERRAKIAGDDMQRSLEKIVRSFPSVKVSRWADFQDIYYDFHRQAMVQEYAFNADPVFKNGVDALTMEFLELPANKAKWKDPNTPPLDIAKRYVLDELAMLTAIPHSFELPLCEIYPGRNELQEAIQANQIQCLAQRLSVKPDRVFMEVYYEPTNTSS